jgi:hypothetical protein
LSCTADLCSCIGQTHTSARCRSHCRRGSSCLWAIGRIAGACFFGVASSGAGAANRVCGRELAIFTAVFVRVVAHSVILELASCRVTACICSAAVFASAVTFFITFYNTVAAGLATEESDTPIVGEAGGFDRVDTHGTADVSDGAGGEEFDIVASRRIHNELTAGVTSGGGEGTALLRGNNGFIAAGVGVAVVNCAKGVPCFVSTYMYASAYIPEDSLQRGHLRNDLPLLQRSNDDISSSDRFRRSIRGVMLLRPCGARLS